MRSVVLGLATALTLTLAVGPAHGAVSVDQAGGPSQERRAQEKRAEFPALSVNRKVTGLDHPWDVRPLGGGRLIFTQRDRATVSIWDNGSTRVVDGFPSGSVWVSGETGLMGLDLDRDFDSNRRFFTCQGGTTAGGGHEVKVMAWTLNESLTAITSSKKLLGGLPTSSGRHGGCRLLALPDGSLLVGTGDAAVGTNPRNLTSLGGKTLRLNAATGAPWRGNPFRKADNRKKRYVFTYGHRNVQGLDRRKDGTLWSVEQGSYRDDEVNRLRKGGDYGWNPVPGYNESVPMTDQSLPGKQWNAVWRSGPSTIATSGGGFVYGKGWRGYHGNFAAAALAGNRVVFLDLTKAGKLKKARTPAALRKLGRIRTVVDGPGSLIYVTTDNGGGDDAIIAVRPRG